MSDKWTVTFRYRNRTELMVRVGPFEAEPEKIAAMGWEHARIHASLAEDSEQYELVQLTAEVEAPIGGGHVVAGGVW